MTLLHKEYSLESDGNYFHNFSSQLYLDLCRDLNVQCGKEAGEQFSEKDCAISHDIIDYQAGVWSLWTVNVRL